MRNVVPAACLVAFGLALAPASARGEDPVPAPPSPVDAAKKVRATFPEPSEKGAFSWDLELIAAGIRVGDAKIAVAFDAEKKRWKGTESVLVGTKEKTQFSLDSATVVEKDLRLVRDERTRNDGSSTNLTVTERSAKGFDVSFKEGAKEPVKSIVEAPEDATTSQIAMVFLFLRSVPAEAAKYEVTAWDADSRALEKRRVEVKGAGRLKDEKLGLDAEAWWAVSTGDDTAEIYLDPKDRSLLALHSLGKDIWLLKKGLYAPKPVGPVPDIKKDATSAKGVGVRFTMGILTGDADVIEASFHWASFAQAIKESQGMELEEDALKMIVMSQLKGSLQSMKSEDAWRVVSGSIDAAEEKPLEGGAVQVHLGPPFGQVNYTAKQIDGKWLITGMEQPK